MSLSAPQRLTRPFGLSLGSGLTIPSGLTLPDAAIARFDHTSIVGSNPVSAWNNLGTGGSGFNLDTVAGTAANLTQLDSGVALLTGTAGDKFTAPDRAGQRGTGDMSLIYRLRATDYTPGADDLLIISGDVATTATTNYSLTIDTTGVLIFSRPTGATARLFTSSAAPTISNGEEIFLQINFDQNNGAAQSQVNFSTSTDGVDFSALGSAQTNANTGAGNSDVTGLTIGSGNDDSLPFDGKITNIKIYSDVVSSSLAAEFDPSQASVNTSTFASGGDTYTLVGDAFLNTTSFPGLYSAGSAGLETAVGQLLTSPVTVFAVFKPTLAAPSNNQVIYDSRASASDRMFLKTRETLSDRYHIFQGGSEIGIAEAYDTDLVVITVQFNGDATTTVTVSGKGTKTGNTGSNDWDALSIMMANSGGTTAIGLLLELDIFDLELPESEVTQMQNRLLARYS